MHFHKLFLCFFILLFSVVANAKSITAIALFNERAMLSIDGEKPKIIRQGSSHLGVKLISSNTDQAVVEFDGKRQTLTLNGTAVLNHKLGGGPASGVAQRSIVLYEDQAGFFQTDGYVDGRRTNFLVDTGANIVVFSSVMADRLGIDYSEGVIGVATTASGRARVFNITLDRISIGGIVLQDVQTGVIEGRFPEVPLLGMSFLGKLEISKKGNKLTLKQ